MSAAKAGDYRDLFFTASFSDFFAPRMDAQSFWYAGVIELQILFEPAQAAK